MRHSTLPGSKGAWSLDALQLLERDFVRVPPIEAACAGGHSQVRARQIAALVNQLGRSL